MYILSSISAIRKFQASDVATQIGYNRFETSQFLTQSWDFSRYRYLYQYLPICYKSLCVRLPSTIPSGRKRGSMYRKSASAYSSLITGIASIIKKFTTMIMFIPGVFIMHVSAAEGAAFCKVKCQTVTIHPRKCVLRRERSVSRFPTELNQ